MVNFNDTDKLIIVIYPPNAGGKFLINCLGLSSEALFQHHWLIERQVSNNFTPLDKFNYLMSNLENTHSEWNDLGLGCSQMLIDGPSELTKKNILMSDKLFFKVYHNPVFDLSEFNNFKNARAIVLYNYLSFINVRRIVTPGTVTSDASIPEYPDKRAIYWDTSTYFSLEKTVHGIRSLYRHFSLPDFNEDYIVKYYLAWQERMQHVANRKYLNNVHSFINKITISNTLP